MTPIVAANNPNHWETRPRPATLNVLRRHAGAVAIASVSAARRRAELSVRSPTVASVFVADDQVIYSASDLAAAARCEYSLLRSFDAQLGWGPPVAVEDELLARTAKLGGEHEQRHLDELRSAADDTVAVIGRPPYTVAGLTAAAEATMRAVERRAPVIYQAAMFDGRFVGFADFLVFDGQQYRLRDTKLARSVKVEALLQLAAYADDPDDGGRASCAGGRVGARRRRHRQLPRRRIASGVPASARRVGAPPRRSSGRWHGGDVGGPG